MCTTIEAKSSIPIELSPTSIQIPMDQKKGMQVNIGIVKSFVYPAGRCLHVHTHSFQVTSELPLILLKLPWSHLLHARHCVPLSSYQHSRNSHNLLLRFLWMKNTACRFTLLLGSQRRAPRYFAQFVSCRSEIGPSPRHR